MYEAACSCWQAKNPFDSEFYEWVESRRAWLTGESEANDVWPTGPAVPQDFVYFPEVRYIVWAMNRIDTLGRTKANQNRWIVLNELPPTVNLSVLASVIGSL